MSEEPAQHLPQEDVRQILALLNAMNTRLTSLEDKVERRLHDTRPIWEQVLVRLDAIEGQLVSFGSRMDGFEGRMVSFESRLDGFEKRLDGFGNELRLSLRRFDRQIEHLAKDVLDVHADQRDLEDRMDKIEPKAT